MRSAWARMACYLLAAVALVPVPYLWHGFHDIIMRGAIATEADQIVFLTLLVASMVLVRLSLGWPLVILSAIALVYAYRSEEHTSELQSLMRLSYAVFCLKKKKQLSDDYDSAAATLILHVPTGSTAAHTTSVSLCALY